MDRKLHQRRQALIFQVREAARRLGAKSLSRAAFCREAGIPAGRVVRDFDSWSDLCRAAGIATRRRWFRLSDDELFAAMRDAFLAAGGIPALNVFERHFRYTRNVLRLRGMGWPQAKVNCRRWLEANDPGFPYLDRLPREVVPRRRKRPPRSPDAPPARIHRALGGRVVGDPVNFRALAHAPVNELGVVLLFGMVARDLGYVVEVLNPSFPDCEARRRVAGGRWERVRIEFEYRSRNFLQHAHDPRGCEIIVCWENNWPDCPLEVLELKRAIAALPP